MVNINQDSDRREKYGGYRSFHHLNDKTFFDFSFYSIVLSNIVQFLSLDTLSMNRKCSRSEMQLKNDLPLGFIQQRAGLSN